jgi:hypothetical protein
MKPAREKQLLVLAFLVTALAVSSWISGCAGFAEPLPPLSVTPSSLSVSIPVGGSSSQPMTVTNHGTISLQISQATVSGAGFNVVGLTTPFTLAAGQSKGFTVRFAASLAGSINGSLSIVTDKQHRPVVVRLHGKAASASPQVTSIRVFPSSASPAPNATMQFTANIQGTTANESVTWTASIGSITASGLYTAPPNSGTIGIVTATSIADPTKSASATVTVAASSSPAPPSSGPAVTSVTISPSSTSATRGGTLQFTATVQGTVTDKSVTWKASLGSITSAGLYTAPANAGTDTVTATSNADTTKSATATVKVTAAPSNPPSAGACPTTISPTGSTDNSNWLTKMKAAVAAGTCVEITAGSYTLSANFTPPDNAQIVCDDDAVVSDTAGYGTSDVMLAFNGITGVTLTGTGRANACELTMPHSYASNINNSDQSNNQYKHALEVSGGSSNITVTGIHVKNSGGDGLYVADATNVTITNVLSEGNIRNGGSATNSFSGLTVQNSTFQNNVNANAGICVGFDDEPNNSAGPNGLTFTGNTMTGNDCSQIPGGLRLSIQNLSSSTPGVKLVINNNTATNNGGADYKEILPTGGLASSASITAAGNVGSNGAVSLPFPE